jgi:hypothetical protein
MIRHDGRGEGAIGGVTGPVPDHRVKKNSNANVAVHDRPPMGMVEIDKRVAKLEGQLETLVDASVAQAARIDALEAALLAVTAATPSRGDVTPRDVDEQTSAGETSAPMTPAERARAYRQRKARGTLPTILTKLEPKDIAVRQPALDRPAIVIPFAEAVAARRAS